MRVLITGGSGFIGSALARRFEGAGRDFLIADKVPSPVFPQRHVFLDITREDSFAAVPGETVGAIVHLAAEHRDDVYPRSRYADVNIEGTRNLVHFAEQAGIERIVFTSSVAVYGFPAPGTDEGGQLDPFNDYGRTKAVAEAVLEEWRAGDPDRRALTIVRPTVVFGPGNRGNVFNLLSQIARGRFVMIGDGRNRKSMAYVDNVAAFLDVALGFGPGRHLYNYVDKPDYDMNTLVRQARSVLHGKGEVGPRLPMPVGLMAGHAADAIARISGRRFPLSAIRVRKFVAETSFACSALSRHGPGAYA